ncbi:ABC transporter ATP-binding protein [Lentilactobacillus hilgardii]|uniref:ATP-binding cassette domain-containing protein n=1 Tax=Lentilactobacillus hilgardii TaxID=1588 RepID=A0A6P1E821_LENHI|nr:ABC transporter ATP-binding protein [Lentilactobacillus hilgardii]RRG11479.1 MAG: ATP-binding cassette domain-containing protein [Lactobacillus sp.]EEI72319.1 cobalt ABC transporter, ATP-binding protein [Lentilactobacillus hilgardii ATCC 27305]MCT3393009.1 ATP-binding cassette domain-containing protein [Lentilactobacillus hilgardii]MCV3740144.1 ABC transporter ATP-binding protein [Lentilactobacillus hilgardii]QHB50853.1 ATP-binding cassette domain-containing protein [Lentilactobacillus hilg
MMREQPIIQFSDVSFQYQSQEEATLHNINLSIHRGEKVFITGPSGSGKSTLGNIINGVIPEEFPGKLTGKITINGQSQKDLDLTDLSFIVGTVLQDPDSQFVGLTVAEDVAFALENDAKPVDELHQKVAEWAQRLNLGPLLGKHPQDLSGGQKQRVSLAGVLVDNEPILLLDEPLANLDPASGRDSMKLLNWLVAQQNLTVIIIDHRIEEVLQIPIDRMIVLAEGRVIADDTPDGILQQNLLLKNGLREPLYVTALKDSGINVSQVTHLSDLTNLKLSRDDYHKLVTWVKQQKLPDKPVSLLPIISLKNMSFAYPNEAAIFKAFNLTINRGEMVALVGKNGTGKTTLINLITGFLKPQNGDLFFGKENISHDSVKQRADRIGYVLQDPNQMISKTMIYDEVALGLQLRGMNSETIKKRVFDTLKITGLYPYRNWPISALSFGQKKRVTIASVLVLQPEVLILDEPTAGQDLAHYSQMMTFLEELNHSQGTTVIMVTHDMNLMMAYANRTIVLDKGGVLADASPAKVLTDKDIIEKAHLAQLSLQVLAEKAQVSDPIEFAEKFISYERRQASGKSTVVL